MNDQPDRLSASPFWAAVSTNDLDTAERLLQSDSSLASKDFRSEEDRDPHTDGFPLHKACAAGHEQMAKLLLAHGADVDARSPTEEQRELGMPLWLAVDRRDVPLANLLLDHGASVDAYAWANASMVERLYEHAVKAGAPVEVIRKGFATYLGETEAAAISHDGPELVTLLDRVLRLGGQPSMESLVEAEYYELVEELLRKCPERPGTKHDHPHGTVFETLCNASSWTGRPIVMELAMNLCPQLHTPALATRAIGRAIVSHNRFGSVEDYYQLIEGQLNYLQQEGALASTIETGAFLPHHKIAKNYLWPNHYGYGESQSSVESMIELTELLIRFGFDDLRQLDADGKSPLQLASEREGHAGLDEYAAYLQSK